MKVLHLLLPLTISIGLANADPGASWTEEEAVIIKAKLYAVINAPIVVSKEYLSLHPEIGFKRWPEGKSMPSAAKLVRLGFHQCLKFSDGSGGCNGCLNNHGMILQNRYSSFFLDSHVIVGIGLENRHKCALGGAANLTDKYTLPNAVKTDNAVLEHTADILEEIFTNASFPSVAMPLQVSLAQSGKSRADLWSLASAVATQWGIERNNRGCQGELVGEPVTVFSLLSVF